MPVTLSGFLKCGSCHGRGERYYMVADARPQAWRGHDWNAVPAKIEIEKVWRPCKACNGQRRIWATQRLTKSIAPSCKTE